MNALTIEVVLSDDSGTEAIVKKTISSGIISDASDSIQNAVSEALHALSASDDESIIEDKDALESHLDDPSNHLLDTDEDGVIYEGEHLKVSLSFDMDIPQEKEQQLLETLLNNENFDFIANPECYSILKEELNNEVLSRFEANYPDAVDSDGESDYSGLTNEIHDQILSDIVSEQSLSVTLGLGDIYTLVREEFSNELYDYILDSLKEEWS